MTGLEAVGVDKRFGGNVALNGVDLGVQTGEIVGLIGPNGSGKTTLLNVLSGALRSDAGQVLLDGSEITRQRAEARAKLGIARTFQEEMSFPSLTVLENVRIAVERGERRRAQDADALEWIEFVGLPAHAVGQNAADLSWGQGRLLGVALGLALKPDFLLLDEPFAGLQRMAAEAVIDVLERTRDLGVGLVIVEHEMSLLLPICDRVYVLAAGERIAAGSPEEILETSEVVDAYFGSTV